MSSSSDYDRPTDKRVGDPDMNETSGGNGVADLEDKSHDSQVLKLSRIECHLDGP